jgi:hypothetical protein
MSAAACPDEHYNRLFIVANHSKAIHPTQQVDIPPNMTVATLTQLNQSIHLRDGQIPTYQFTNLFSRYGPIDSRGFASLVLPTDSDIQSVLSRLRELGMVYATHHGNPQPPCEFRQRKNEAAMTVQECFLPGGFVHSGIHEFSRYNSMGFDVSDAILGPKVDTQLYRETSDKDRTIIDIERTLMPGLPGQFVRCPDDYSIIHHSRGRITKEDIDSLHANRERYKSAIQFNPAIPIDIFCSYDIADVERWRRDIVEIILSSQHIKTMMTEVYEGKQDNSAVVKYIILGLKQKSKKIDKLTPYLIDNVIVCMKNGFYDHKIVSTGHEPLRSDELFDRIHRYSGNDKVYIVFIGCRYVQSPNPAERAVMHSPRSSRGSTMDFGGGKKLRRRSMNKSKTRKITTRIHKKRFINRSHR